jgi:hypothetical protein
MQIRAGLRALAMLIGMAAAETLRIAIGLCPPFERNSIPPLRPENDRLKSLQKGAIQTAALLAAMLLSPPIALAQTAPQPEGDHPVAVQDAPAASDAQQAQNPIANVISIPIQNNTYLNDGPYRYTANILVIQPVIPISISDDWNLISRWVTPIAALPRVSPTQGNKFGLGNMEPEFYFSPTHVGDVIWGIGPKLWLPTATDKALGLNKWGAGPTAVVLTIQGPWLYGVLANNVWAGSGTQKANQLTINPFANYNFSDGWYLSSSDLITANWMAKSGQQWTVPIGGGVGRLFRAGSLPINARFSVFNNVVHPQGAPNWQLQLQIQLLFKAH